jgi:hypothetical protein
MRHDRDEFYVGYLPASPADLSRWVRRRVGLAVFAFVLVGAALAASMAEFPAKAFEFGGSRSLAGWIRAEPVPSLLVRAPGRASEDAAWARYLLVRPGKAGANEDVAGLDGCFVQLEGTLVYREDQAMIEIVPGTIRPAQAAGASPPPAVVVDLGVQTLVGEIVDSKCYLGVMSPGDTKVHRECAARCISGGIPPLFLVREAGGRAAYLLLLSADGRSINREVLPMIAEPLEITGRVERHPDLLVLKADPSTYRRLT